jgi:hypothetical protein
MKLDKKVAMFIDIAKIKLNNVSEDLIKIDKLEFSQVDSVSISRRQQST